MFCLYSLYTQSPIPLPYYQSPTNSIEKKGEENALFQESVGQYKFYIKIIKKNDRMISFEFPSKYPIPNIQPLIFKPKTIMEKKRKKKR